MTTDHANDSPGFNKKGSISGLEPNTETSEPSGHWLEDRQDAFAQFCSDNAARLRRGGFVLFLLACVAYLVCAALYDPEGAIPLFVVTGLIIAWRIYRWLYDHFHVAIWQNCLGPVTGVLKSHWDHIQWLLLPVLLLIFLLYIFVLLRDVRQLQSLLGLVFCLFIPYITCNRPSKIRWRPVFWGLALQFFLGVVTLRWKPGYLAVKWLSEQLNTFLFYALEGAGMAFGDPFFLLHPLAFMTLPIVIYIGAVTGLLYWMGAVQAAVRKVGYFMSLTLGTTGVESVNIVLSIFFSVAEVAVAMKPYLDKLTHSEMYTLLVRAHASIAGFAYPLFVLVGVDGRHLLTASIMSAPAAVAISKLNFPETEESKFKSDDCYFEVESEGNPGLAMSQAAKQAGKTCATLLVQIIAFISIYSFFDAGLEYLGARVGLELSFQILFGYAFMPVAYLIGVDWQEAGDVASIVGVKLTINEVIAYVQLGSARTNFALTERASMLTTYAICGFSSLGTLAIFLGVWASVISSRSREISRLMPRVYLNTNLSCFLTACIAGLMYNEDVNWGIDDESPRFNLGSVAGFLPSYKALFDAVGI